jgi:hypothetical protein
MALISSGTASYELSLVNLMTSDVEIYITVDDSKNKDNLSAFTPSVAQYYKENKFENCGGSNRQYETNYGLYRRYL